MVFIPVTIKDNVSITHPGEYRSFGRGDLTLNQYLINLASQVRVIGVYWQQRIEIIEFWCGRMTITRTNKMKV